MFIMELADNYIALATISKEEVFKWINE